ncbi:MAG: pantetheine-phosphate adenylyltransferase [bacterium]|nr:pantetheine-phosphate adenylyltransferase [Candidatus Kapabacteria bacterium]
MTRTVVYPGTFDPITNGHIDIISRVARMFDHVVVAIAINASKQPMFSHDERVALVVESLRDYANVEVKLSDGLIVDFAEEVGAMAIVRGLRAVSDFEYEMQMALMNRRMRESISTIFMMPNEKYTFLSSSIIRELARYKADVSDFVPECVVSALARRNPHSDPP